MKRISRLALRALALLTVLFRFSTGLAFDTNGTSSTISIDPSSTAVAVGGKATLTIGTLTREGEMFLGNYQVKVSPYSFKNEKGKIVMVVSDDSMRQVTNTGGKILITGTATADNGNVRKIAVMAVPTNNACGTVQISFPGTKRKTIFNSVYHLDQR